MTTRKELQEWLEQYPEDSEVHCEITLDSQLAGTFSLNASIDECAEYKGKIYLKTYDWVKL